MAPGITWVNNGSDGGDLIATAFTDGIEHPTGYLSNLLLARLFQFIPVGSLAYCTNLLSVAAAVFSVVFIYCLVTHTQSNLGFDHIRLASLTAGISFGSAPLVWSQAVITEVYAIQAFLTELIRDLIVFPFDMEQKRLERLCGLVLGLSMGKHVTKLLLLALIVFFGIQK